MDKQGRILIPGLLRESAGLVKEIVFVGMMNRVEIWDKAVLLDEEEAEDAASLDETMDELDISL